MPWQVGRWSLADQVAGDAGGEWGTLLGFTVTGGRQGIDLSYIGFTATLTFQDGPAWTDYSSNVPPDYNTDSDPVQRVDGLAIRWTDDTTQWSSKGPPLLFVGRVTSAQVRYAVDADGRNRIIAEVTAEDWLATSSRIPLPSVPSAPPSAYQAIRDYGRGSYTSIRLGPIEPSGIVDIADGTDLGETVRTIGDVVRLVSDSTGVDVFMRHGERLSTATPPTPGSSTQFAATRPEIVVRAADGPSTFDASPVLVQIDGEAQSALTGGPISRRFDLDRHGKPTEVLVDSPLIVDRVDLTDNAGRTAVRTVDGYSSTAVRAQIVRTGLASGSQEVLDAAADRLLSSNSQAHRQIVATWVGLDESGIAYWSGIGIADEVILPARYGLGAIRSGGSEDSVTIALVRSVNWSVNSDTADLTLGMATYTAPLNLLSTTMTVGYSNLSVLGAVHESLGVANYGSIAHREFQALDGTDVVIVSLTTNYSTPPAGAVELLLSSEEQAIAVEGMWLLIDGVGFPLRSEFRFNPNNRRHFQWLDRNRDWRFGDTVQVVISGDRPEEIAPVDRYSRVPLDDEVWHSRVLVGRAGQTDVYGVIIPPMPDGQRWGDFTESIQFNHSGGQRQVRRLEWDSGATGDNMRIDFDSEASAQACVGLWLLIGERVKHHLVAGDRTGEAFTWRDTDLSWSWGEFTQAGLYSAEPEVPPERVHRATITVGHSSGWDGWTVGQYGSIESGGQSFQHNGFAVTLQSVRFHDSTNTFRLKTANSGGDNALANLWVRMGNTVGELAPMPGNPDQFGWAFTPHLQPNWTEVGSSVDFELWTDDPTFGLVWESTLTVGTGTGPFAGATGYVETLNIQFGTLTDRYVPIRGSTVTLTHLFHHGGRLHVRPQAQSLNGYWIRVGEGTAHRLAAEGNVNLRTPVGSYPASPFADGETVTVSIYRTEP